MRSAFLTSTLLCFATALLPAEDQVLRFPPYLVEEKSVGQTSSGSTEIGFSANDTGATAASLNGRIPNFYVADNGAHSFNNTLALRGMSNTPIFGDPAVTFYLDDIPLGGGFTTPDSFPGVTRATLFHSPLQGATFGRSGSAGIVQLSSDDLAKDSRGEIDLTAGNHAFRSVSIDESAVSRSTDLLVAGGYAARDGYVFNRRLNQDVDHRESTSALARLKTRVADGLKLIVLVEGERARDGEQPLVPLGGDYFTIDRSTQGQTAFDRLNAGITVKLTRAWGEISATSSVNDWHLGPYRSALSFGPAELVSDVDLKRRNYNQELKYSWFTADSVCGNAGFYFSHEETDGVFNRSIGPYPVEASSYTIMTRRMTAFADATYALRPDLDFTACIRFEDTKSGLDRLQPAPAPGSYSLERASGAALPRAEFDWKAGRNIGVFIGAGGSCKAGGFSAFTGNRELSTFGPERTFGVETGFSWHDPSKAVQTTVRMFDYRISGYQIERSFATGSTSDDYLVVNAPRANSQGGEVELQWHAAKTWTLSSTYGYTDARLRNFTDPYTHQSYNDKPVPYAPQNSLVVQSDWQMDSGFFLTLRWSAVGRTYYTEGEDPAFAQPAYDLLGSRIGFRAPSWRVAAYVDNACNKAYYGSISPGTHHASPGAPRTFGFEFAKAY